MSKGRQWKLTDGLISWSYGTVNVIELNAYTEALAQIAKLEAALDELNKPYEPMGHRNNLTFPDVILAEALTSLAAWKKENLR